MVRSTKPKTARARRVPGRRLHLELARAIGSGILDGTYQPESLLPNEAEWSARFKASRTAVREAIKALTGKGLVVSRPKVGSRVQPRSHWNLLDRDVLEWHAASMDRPTLLASIQEARRILEPGIAELAAAKRSLLQLKRLAGALDSMAVAANASEIVGPDVEFHLALLDAANNDLLIPFGSIIEQAFFQMFRYTSLHHPKPTDVIALHRAVYDAVARGDRKAARAAVETLLADTDSIVVTMRPDAAQPE